MALSDLQALAERGAAARGSALDFNPWAALKSNTHARAQSLEAAVYVVGPLSRPEDVLRAARQFEAYLTGA